MMAIFFLQGLRIGLETGTVGGHANGGVERGSPTAHLEAWFYRLIILLKTLLF